MNTVDVIADIQSQVKYLTYQGCDDPPPEPARLAYLVCEGNHIIFTAAEDVTKKETTLGAPTIIVRKICEAEGLEWNKCTFYDLQTGVGYPHQGMIYIAFDELVFFNNYSLRLKKWESHLKGGQPDCLRDEVLAILQLLKVR